MSIKILGPNVKKYLTGEGYTFTNDIAMADAMISIEADSRRGNEIHGMFVAYVDMTISVTNMNSGAEVYKNTLQNKKGIQLSYDAAGLKAYENISKLFHEQIIPDILKSMK